MSETLRTGDTIVFVGRRQGAADAAKALDLRTLTVTNGPSEQRGKRRWSQPFETPERMRELATEFAEHGPIRAVFALTESAVVPAAHLRVALDLPGQSVAAALRSTDKVAMKATVRASGIPCADWVQGEEGLDRTTLIDRLGLPLVVKARASSGSRGTQVMRAAPDVPEQLDPTWMAESLVTGTEMSIESFVIDGEVVFRNPTEYFRPGWANIVPAVVDPDTWLRVRSLNDAAIAALGVASGIVHCEVFVDRDTVVFGELATRPPGGHLMELIRRAYDFDPWEALLRIGLGQSVEFPEATARHAGVWLLHPGAGTLTDVHGVETARALPGVVDLPFKGRVGDDVATRVGVGQELGHITVVGSTRDDVARDLVAAHAAINLTVIRSR